MAWIWLVLASLLSCAGQLCQKQATRAGGGQQVALWLGLALLMLGGGMVAGWWYCSICPSGWRTPC